MPNTNSPSSDILDTLRGDHLTDKKDMILTCVHSKTIASYFIGKIRAIVVEKLTKKDTHAQNLFYYDPKKKRDNDVFRIVLKVKIIVLLFLIQIVGINIQTNIIIVLDL